MRLSNMDLNLFVAFDAIYSEGSLTRAGKKIHLSQPALSHALSRLREALQDPLFSRQGRRLVPTPFARSLAGQVRQSLLMLEYSITPTAAFEPAQTNRTFHLGIASLLEATWLPPLATALRTFAPSIDLISCTVARSQIESELTADALDAVIDIPVPCSDAIRHMPLWDDRVVVLARKNHPRVGKKLDLPTYLSLPHIVVSSRRGGINHEGIALNRLGYRRRVALRCQNYVAACFAVRDTDMILTMPEHYARIVNGPIGNVVLSPPVEIPRLAVHLYWAAASEADPANRWLREQLVVAGRDQLQAR